MSANGARAEVDLFGEHSRVAFLGGVPEATRLYLIRHGEAEHPGVHGMALNPPLSALGREQAAAAARRLATMRLDHIYSSPIRRARETAEATARHYGLEVREDEGLSEVRWQPPDQSAPVPAEAGAIAYRFAAHGRLRTLRWADFPGFEPGAELRARVVAAVDRIAARHPGETVAIFAHFGVVNAYLAHLFDAEADVLFPVINTSITTVMAHGEYRGIRGINDYAHLTLEPERTEWGGGPGVRP